MSKMIDVEGEKDNTVYGPSYVLTSVPTRITTTGSVLLSSTTSAASNADAASPHRTTLIWVPLHQVDG